MDSKKKTCKKCKFLGEQYRRTPGSDRDYWIMTELFALLHNGDVCKKGIKEKQGKKDGE